jgi:hypothetical protein
MGAFSIASAAAAAVALVPAAAAGSGEPSRSAPRIGDIYAMNADGGVERQLTSGSYSTTSLSGLPKGARSCSRANTVASPDGIEATCSSSPQTAGASGG